MDWSSVEFISIERSLDHIAKHQVTLKEVELSLNGKTYSRKIPGRRYMIIGNANGRILRIIIEIIHANKYYLVTAYDAPLKDKKLYRKRSN